MTDAPMQPEPQDVIDAFRFQRDIMANDAAYLRAAVTLRDREIARLRDELGAALAQVAASKPPTIAEAVTDELARLRSEAA